MIRKPKGPTARARAAKRRKQLNTERAIKIQVRLRDGAICRCCGTRKAESVHEIIPKSLGGKVSLENSIHVCGDGVHGCHGFLQRREIEVMNVPVNANNGSFLVCQTKSKAAAIWLDRLQ